MKFSILSVDTRTRGIPCPEARVAYVEQFSGLNVYGGESLNGRLPLLHVEAVDAHPSEAPPGLTDFFRTTDFDVGSIKLCKILERFEGEVECLPTILSYNSRNIENQYYVLNSLKRIKALNMNNSVVEIDEEIGVVGASKIVLDESKLAGVHWCVIDEINRVVVSQEMENAIRNAGCVGCMFLSVDKFEF